MFIKKLSGEHGTAEQNRIIELGFTADAAPSDLHQSVSLTVEFVHGDGTRILGQGFCFKEKDFRVRFAPQKTGLYRWFTHSTDEGLDGHTGTLLVEPGDGENIFVRHGDIEIDPTRSYFVHRDGTPFFWLGEGLWAVAQQATEDELDTYFAFRKKQGFNVIAFNTLLNWESTTPYRREPFLYEDGQPNLSRYDPDYFEFLDGVFDRCAENGMVAAPVVLWFNYLPGPKPEWYDPPYDWPVMSEDQAYQLGKFLGARYGAYPVLWLLSADIADYQPEAAAVLEAAVRGLRESSFSPPIISSHIAAKSAYRPYLVRQDWHDFHFIQSGHRKDSVGFPAAYCRAVLKQTPRKPVVNGEMFFEGLGHTREKDKVSLDLIRRAAWESVLAGAKAGISYGAHGMWCWYNPDLEFRMHYLWQIPTPWKEALHFPGPKTYQTLKDFFAPLPWYDLVEATDLPIHEQGQEPAIAARLGGGQFVVIYLPEMRALRLTDLGLQQAPARWFDPVSAQYEPANCETAQGGVSVQPASWSHDGVLLIGPLS